MDTNFITYFKRFFSGTLLSRITGLGRDLAMAFAFGDNPSVAAFMVAFRLSNLLRRLLGEGPFQSAFIPSFEGLRVKNEKESSQFFRELTFLMTLFILFITLIAEGGLYFLSSSGYFSESTVEILSLTAWLFPGLLFVCLYGLNLSLLNCYNSFFIPSCAPVVFNTVWIMTALFLRHQEPQMAMISLSKWVVVGFFGQWLLTLPLTIRYTKSDWKEWFRGSISPQVKELLKGFTLGAIGVGAVQINAFADAFFARFADLRGPVYLWYSIRLEQLALAILGIACVTTVIPSLSRAIKKGHLAEARALFERSHARIFFMMLPATFAIFATGLNAVHLIYGRGSFSDLAVLKTSFCLFGYASGLLPATWVIFFAALFYAQGDFKKPMWISISAVALNLFFNFLFVFIFGWGAISVTLATTLSSWFNSFLLLYYLRKSGWHTSLPLSSCLSVIAASLFALLSVIIFDAFFLSGNLMRLIIDGTFSSSEGFLPNTLYLMGQFLVFLSSFLLFGLMFKNKEISSFLKNIFTKKEFEFSE